MNETLIDVVQLLNDSEAALVTIKERNVNFSTINSMVNGKLQDAKMKLNDSQSFLQNRTLENTRINNVSNQLKMLQAILQDKYSLSSNVSSILDDIIINNTNLNNNISRLQVLSWYLKHCFLLTLSIEHFKHYCLAK